MLFLLPHILHLSLQYQDKRHSRDQKQEHSNRPNVLTDCKNQTRSEMIVCQGIASTNFAHKYRILSVRSSQSQTFLRETEEKNIHKNLLLTIVLKPPDSILPITGTKFVSPLQIQRELYCRDDTHQILPIEETSKRTELQRHHDLQRSPEPSTLPPTASRSGVQTECRKLSSACCSDEKNSYPEPGFRASSVRS
ncbi:hypothetical protein Mapa_000145 [Marchantia paleacea]|nr:hypothetical protein Mapa_000145 [Marchantia paleacea]